MGIICDDPGPKKALKPTIFALRATFFAKMGKKKFRASRENFLKNPKN